MPKESYSGLKLPKKAYHGLKLPIKIPLMAK